MGFFAESQRNLVPLGGNFYSTPNTPADPRDCDRYPNSPYCSGGFLDLAPLRITPQIVADRCNLGVAIHGTFGFIKLPILQIVHRNPECIPPPPPVAPPTPKGEDCEVLYCRDGSTIKTVLSTAYANPGTAGNPGNFPAGTDSQTIMDFNYDLAMTTASDRVKGLRDDAANGTTVNPLFKNIRSVVEPFGNPGFHPQTDALPFFQIATTKEGITTISDDEFTTLDNPPTRLSRYDGNIECKYTISKVYFDYLTDDNLASYVENAYYENGYWIATKFKKRLCKPPTPPPPQPPKMECCPGQSDLLKLILKRIGTLPVIVPNSYLTKNGTQPIQNKNVESLTDFIAYFAERFDEVLGEFEINIQIQGDDNKSTTLKLPNLAEAIAEMFTMVIHSNMNNELILNIANRILAESGQIKQTSFKNHSALTALIDYAGFHTEMSVEQMPLTFTPGQKSFNTVLKESSQDVSVIKYTQKETLATAIHTLLQAAAIIRGVHYAKTPGGQAAVVKKLKEDLMGLVGDQNQGSLSDQIKTFVNNIDKVYDGINNKPSQP